MPTTLSLGSELSCTKSFADPLGFVIEYFQYHQTIGATGTSAYWICSAKSHLPCAVSPLLRSPRPRPGRAIHTGVSNTQMVPLPDGMRSSSLSVESSSLCWHVVGR